MAFVDPSNYYEMMWLWKYNREKNIKGHLADWIRWAVVGCLACWLVGLLGRWAVGLVHGSLVKAKGLYCTAAIVQAIRAIFGPTLVWRQAAANL